MRKKYRSKKTSNKLIILLVAILFVSLGYALYSQQLEINGIISGSARFKVYFAEAWIKHSSSEEDHTDTPHGDNEAEIASGTVNINTSAGADKVQFNVTLNCPGDKVLIGTRIKNESSMRVKLNDFLVTKSVDIPDIVMNYIPLSTTTEKLDPDGECIYEFVVEWVSTSSETNPGPVRFDIELDYEQDPDPAPPVVNPSHDHGEGEIYTAYFDANGGTVSQTLKNITHGQMYGALPTPRKTNNKFLGWYTSVDGGTQITESDVVSIESDITLYAKWDEVVETYACTKSVKTFTAPYTGEYLLEAWGAQGGDAPEVTNNSKVMAAVEGGKGGYSSGIVSLIEGDEVYVVVGAAGGSLCDVKDSVKPGGYNGGGQALADDIRNSQGSGGGATHFAINNNLGELKNYSNNQDDVLIVAGGGGGSYNSAGIWYYSIGGAGGGENGEPAIVNYNTSYISSALTNSGFTYTQGFQIPGATQSQQTTPTTYYYGTFGQGTNAVKSLTGTDAGAGGGWYGGNKLSRNTGAGGMAGSGGSGHINGLKVINGNTITGSEMIPSKTDSGTMIGNSGDGYARISLIN